MTTVLVMICAALSPAKVKLQVDAIHAKRPNAVVVLQRVRCNSSFEFID